MKYLKLFEHSDFPIWKKIQIEIERSEEIPSVVPGLKGANINYYKIINKPKGKYLLLTEYGDVSINYISVNPLNGLPCISTSSQYITVTHYLPLSGITKLPKE